MEATYEAQPYVYPTSALFNVPHLIEGINAFGTMSKLIAGETEVRDLLIVGQRDPVQAEIFRVLIVFLHLPSNTLGVQAVDITRELLTDLQLAGSPGTPAAD